MGTGLLLRESKADAHLEERPPCCRGHWHLLPPSCWPGPRGYTGSPRGSPPLRRRSLGRICPDPRDSPPSSLEDPLCHFQGVGPLNAPSPLYSWTHFPSCHPPGLLRGTNLVLFFSGGGLCQQKVVCPRLQILAELPQRVEEVWPWCREGRVHSLMSPLLEVGEAGLPLRRQLHLLQLASSF